MYTLQYFVYQITEYDAFINLLIIYEKVGSMNFYDPSEKSVDESSTSYTLRSIPLFLDVNVTDEARAAGKPKGTYAREFLEEQLGDPVTSWIRSHALVASMDEDLAESCGATLSRDRYEICLSVQEAQAYRRLLNINSNADLKRVLFDNAAHLHYQAAKDLMLRQTVPRGTSMRLALFCELAGRDRPVVDEAWLRIFFSSRPGAYERYLDDIDTVRELKKLEPLTWAVIHRGSQVKVKIGQPPGCQNGTWRMHIEVNPGVGMTSQRIPVYGIPSRLIAADPGYSDVVKMGENHFEHAMKFHAGRCELHMYTSGVAEENNPSPPAAAAQMIAEYLQGWLLDPVKVI
ncbi:hypothetical protein PUG81_28230 [Erwiniaceae bacterium L1_54_6]|nr:hypothetical protein [Erwiniaceae bacterium L1_54_6]